MPLQEVTRANLCAFCALLKPQRPGGIILSLKVWVWLHLVVHNELQEKRHTVKWCVLGSSNVIEVPVERRYGVNQSINQSINQSVSQSVSQCPGLTDNENRMMLCSLMTQYTDVWRLSTSTPKSRTFWTIGIRHCRVGDSKASAFRFVPRTACSQPTATELFQLAAVRIWNSLP